MRDDDELTELLSRNRAWAAEVSRAQPDFFRKLAEQQVPRYLWIGCSDSRVPANQILGLMPGEIFVHRNVANVVVQDDLNCLSVVQFAVDVLKIRHIIVCGHYGCGGVEAVLHNRKLGLIDDWLCHVQDVRRHHAAEIDALQSDAARLRRLCELNVLAQVANVAKTSLVKEAWARGQSLSVHGLVYDLQDGVLRRLGPAIDRPEPEGAGGSC